ncbi:FAD-containing monooxygenase EthA [Aeromicrobium sp. Root344]|uniref:flavin-containing monooxygenase n=1 Tax=Aeromicrobium sp. Root344 TaxID=1736521 RepID=UPI0006F690E1|nr:NAD(P)/FAD-dependent oxidoreductase [Aeromicrobium sp. Root344]KQV75868.1 FAD-containing monooxygenase EthA [Aeromicrobium sp. Root344]
MSADTTTPEHVDVIIVGAGLSGIGAAYRLQEQCPGKSYAILEAREAVGGTWDLFRYPGIRSDSDMYTLSFPFRPWTNRKSIADGEHIRDYISDAADEFGIAEHIQFGHRVVSASWSSEDARWTVTSQVGDARIVQTASFLYLCSGYYNYDKGFQPEFPGLDSFDGQVVHPQFWPEDLDYAGKKVVVIGSGATAVTLIPSMAEDVEHITMLQRSPTYITTLPAEDKLAQVMRKVLPANLAHRAVRRKNAIVTIGFYQFCRRFPAAATKLLLGRVKRQLPEGADMTHFTPRYKPWDQRLCIVPNGDLFRVIRRGKASIVTDTIKTFTPTGIELDSGQHLDADVVVTATGLQVVAFGQLEIEVDGQRVDPHEVYVYKGLMFSGVPNLAWCVGYTNASWTLRADLSSQYVCQYLNHLDAKGYAFGMPDPKGAAGQARPILDLTSGYVMRVADLLPQQGTSSPWTIRQNWLLDSYDMKRTDLEQDMVFEKATVSVSA